MSLRRGQAASFGDSDRVRGGRPSALSRRRAQIDVWRPLSVRVEAERDERGVATSATLFLAGAECPFACVFCDLWQFTVEGATPRTAIPTQIERGLEKIAGLGVRRLKLYNASNFFEARAVPRSDDARILASISSFDTVIVECHPRLVGARCLEYAQSLDSRLEVALGLETANPGALARLGKQVELADFDRAVDRLLRHSARVRAFVLVGTPFVEAEQQVEWAVRSVEHALARGVSVVALIPVRGGGELDRLRRDGHWTPPSLGLVEDIFDLVLEDRRGAVQVDLWDLSRHAECSGCFGERRERLRRMNLTGRRQDRVDCNRCRESPARDFGIGVEPR